MLVAQLIFDSVQAGCKNACELFKKVPHYFFGSQEKQPTQYQKHTGWSEIGIIV